MNKRAICRRNAGSLC